MTAEFGAALTRLLARRELDLGALSRSTGADERELVAVLDGATPSGPTLRGLARALGMDASDLYAIADIDLPDDLAPSGCESGGHVVSLVWVLVHVPEAGRRVHDLVRSAPREDRAEPARTRERDRWRGGGPGAMLLRLLGNRNLRSSDAVKVLYMLAGFGPWSSATLAMVGAGRKEISADLLTACATVLGIPAGDLAALTGIEPAGQDRWTHPSTPDALDLIWRARGLSCARLAEIFKQAHAVRHEYDDVVPEALVCHCDLFRGSSAGR